MIAQLVSAVVRAILVVIVIATPSLLIPAVTPDAAVVVMLVALAAGVFTFSEYASTYPGLIEFRDAPPFNRVRVICIFITLFTLSLIVRASGDAGPITVILNATGLVLAHALDFQYSPLWLLQVFLPSDTTAAELTMLRTLGGMSFLIGLITLAVFAILMRLHGWPNRQTQFNVWVNLPTFDPTAGGDVVTRLIRDSRVNLILGLVMPFLMPVLASKGVAHLGHAATSSPQLMVWMITLWSFLPVSLFMRAMAMHRIAVMIVARRKQVLQDVAEEEEAGLLPA